MSRNANVGVINLLAEKWPCCFSIPDSQRRPLKLGIREVAVIFKRPVSPLTLIEPFGRPLGGGAGSGPSRAANARRLRRRLHPSAPEIGFLAIASR